MRKCKEVIKLGMRRSWARNDWIPWSKTSIVVKMSFINFHVIEISLKIVMKGHAPEANCTKVGHNTWSLLLTAW